MYNMAKNSANEIPEKNFLRDYDASHYARPNITVDVAIFTVQDGALKVLIVKRSAHPCKGDWALPGGFIDICLDADLNDAALRKLREKTGVASPYLEQFATFGNDKRDPRGWSVTTVYFALLPNAGLAASSEKGFEQSKWATVGQGGTINDRLAFDHAEILAGCVARLRNKVLYTSLPLYLMPETFTLGELQKVHELILGTDLEHKSFRRRILGAELLEETDLFRHEAKRPARLYRLKTGAPHIFNRIIEGTRRA